MMNCLLARNVTVLGRRLGALIFAVLFLGAAPGASSPIELPEKPRPDERPRGAVLTGTVALDAAQDFCQDSEPGQQLTLWEPGPAEISRLETLLPKFMARQKTPPDYQPLHEYYRQYVGVVRDGKKRICVNFVHYIIVREYLERPKSNPFIMKTVQDGGRAEDFWKYEPIVVDDGGADFFKVQFDVETDTFMVLRFNGYA